jgi:amino acid permease
MFSFEGNGIVINLKAEAKDKKVYPSLLRLAILTVIIWYMAIAFVTYATFKSETGLTDYVTQNLPITPFTIVINVFFCINAISSYPL